jgi:hypothetical protein
MLHKDLHSDMFHHLCVPVHWSRISIPSRHPSHPVPCSQEGLYEAPLLIVPQAPQLLVYDYQCSLHCPHHGSSLFSDSPSPLPPTMKHHVHLSTPIPHAHTHSCMLLLVKHLLPIQTIRKTNQSHHYQTGNSAAWHPHGHLMFIMCLLMH